MKIGIISAIFFAMCGSLVSAMSIDEANLCEASARGKSELVRELLTYSHIDPSVNDNYAIKNSARHGQLDVVRLLLADDRVDPKIMLSKRLLLPVTVWWLNYSWTMHGSSEA